jgi:hypothetical protein
MSGMNWSRARMDGIISTRGSDWAYDEIPYEGRPRWSRPERAKTKPAKAAKPKKPAQSRPPVDPWSLPTHERREALRDARTALRREFAGLPIDDRRGMAAEFRARLGSLAESESAADVLWRTNFQSLLRRPKGTGRGTVAKRTKPQNSRGRHRRDTKER